jgi:hypothetical protein
MSWLPPAMSALSGELKKIEVKVSVVVEVEGPGGAAGRSYAVSTMPEAMTAHWQT